MKIRLPGLLAALVWALFCVRWFDAAGAWRPAWVSAIPVLPLGVALAFGVLALLYRHQRFLSLIPSGSPPRELWMVLALALAFRLPMVVTAAAGYTSADGSLSGNVALRIRDGISHLVFVPNVPYSGSLKSHIAAALGNVMDLQRAFTLSSVLFYALFVGAIYGLALRTRWDTARLAAFYAIFAPAFVTRYSLSNDGNYVEVMGLGTLALLYAARSVDAEERAQPVLAWAAGVLLGLAFWCHILAVIHAAAVGLVFLMAGARNAARTVPRLTAGFVLGALPSVLWNAVNGWESLAYVLPGGHPVGSLATGPAWPERLVGIASDHLLVLAGYDLGSTGAQAIVLRVFASLALFAILIAYAQALRTFGNQRDSTRGALLVFTAVNLVIAVAGLPYIPGNARYLQFLIAPIAVFLADAMGTGPRRIVLGLLIAGGALSSLSQWPAEQYSDARWRAFVADLEKAGVTRCYADFYLAAKIDFISEERVVCSSEIGPTTTEYFMDFRDTVQAAPNPAFIAVNRTAADKLERKLQRIGVEYRRLELMKPVIVPARHVRPAELFTSTESLAD